MRRMRALDLFCGTGGFSRGAHAAGFDVVAAYDIDEDLTYSFGKNFPKTKLKLADISGLTADDIKKDVGHDHIDLIFGGPPCQGFSAIGRRDATDPRRNLLRHFFRIVAEIRPSVFVMENVDGLLYQDARYVLDDALALVKDDYEIIGPEVLNAADFGSATNRRRAFVIGYNRDVCAPFDWSTFEKAKRPAATVNEAIADLKGPTFISNDKHGFDVWKLKKRSYRSLYAKRLAAREGHFTGNKRTEHQPHVIERFIKLKQGGFDPIGKYPRLSWGQQCPTLRAGTGADKGSHQAIRPIHPDEPRVITVREAARLQGFPDNHYFHPTIWHSFRQIGNSVSPIIARAVLTVLHSKLAEGAALAEAAE